MKCVFCINWSVFISGLAQNNPLPKWPTGSSKTAHQCGSEWLLVGCFDNSRVRTAHTAVQNGHHSFSAALLFIFEGMKCVREWLGSETSWQLRLNAEVECSWICVIAPWWNSVHNSCATLLFSCGPKSLLDVEITLKNVIFCKSPGILHNCSSVKCVRRVVNMMIILQPFAT